MLLKENVEDDGNGERFLDVADAYMESDQSDTALPILHRCVNSKNYGQVGNAMGLCFFSYHDIVLLLLFLSATFSFVKLYEAQCVCVLVVVLVVLVVVVIVAVVAIATVSLVMMIFLKHRCM